MTEKLTKTRTEMEVRLRAQIEGELDEEMKTARRKEVEFLFY